MTAAEILALKPADYALLFGRSVDLAPKYKALLLHWHPDRNPAAEATAVTAHINLLHQEACKATSEGHWESPNVLRVTRDGRLFDFRFRHRAPLPAGEILIGATRSLVVAADGQGDLIDQARQMMAGIPRAPRQMEEEFAHLMPVSEPGGPADAAKKGYLLRTGDTVRLRDLLDKRGPLPPKHVAWVMSGAYNLACFLQHAGITHLGLDADHLWIEPATHRVALFGGWEFAGLRSKPLAATPHAARVLGSSLTRDAVDRRHHLNLIRALGRDCLGDPSGARLSSRSDLPRHFIRWLQLPAGNDAPSEYTAWGKCLTESFGPRRFQVLETTASDIYGS